MKQNKIAKEFFLMPHIKLAAVLLLFTGMSVSVGEFGKYYSPKNAVFHNTSESLIVALSALLMLTIYVSDKKRAKNISGHIIRNYLKEIISENNDLKIFDSVLYDDQTMNSISTYLINTLTESERKEILNILHKMDGNIHYTKTRPNKDQSISDFKVQQQKQMKFDRFNHVKKCHAEILQIIRDHASIHPEFINEIRYAIYTNAKHINIQDQFVR